tara:strand:+ start:1403 stop:2986 length:1584 start_codon:yes stop_codon:yes gene_type:complete
MSVTQKQRQVKEIVKCGKNPQYFFNRYVKIQHPIKGAIPFKTYGFQNDCVDAFVEHRFNVILKSRQLGLSTITAAYAAWLGIFHKDKNILVIATKLSVAQNFIRKVKFVIQSMPKWLLLPAIINNNKQALEFSNGSTIKAIPTSEDAGRSEALTLLIVDEAAFVRNFDTLWTGLYPTLSTGGRAIVLSTPNGVGGQYYDIWKQAEDGENIFNAIKLPWDVHPERDDQWFKEETKNMSQKQIAQELLCDFAASGDTFLQVEDIEYLRGWIRNPIDKWGPDMGVWVWDYPHSGKKYIISADVSRGDASDYSTFHIIDTDASAVVAEYRGKLPPDKFAQILAEAGRRYNDALICPENNSYGYAVVMKLNEMDYRNLYFQSEKDRFAFLYGNGDIGKIGFQTNAKTRNQILTKLEEVLRTKQVMVKSSRLYEELKTFVWKNGKAQAQKGQNDDLIMALAIGVWLYDTSPQLNKHSTDLNAAMLAAFAVNSTKIEDTVIPDATIQTNEPTKGKKKSWPGSNNPYTDFTWLVK